MFRLPLVLFLKVKSDRYVPFSSPPQKIDKSLNIKFVFMIKAVRLLHIFYFNAEMSWAFNVQIDK